jgi:hypothetical protein
MALGGKGLEIGKIVEGEIAGGEREKAGVEGGQAAAILSNILARQKMVTMDQL